MLFASMTHVSPKWRLYGVNRGHASFARGETHFHVAVLAVDPGSLEALRLMAGVRRSMHFLSRQHTREYVYIILLYYIVCYLIHTLISCYIVLFLVCDVSYMLQLHSAIDVNGLYCMIYDLCNFMPLINKDRAAGM